MGKKTVEFVQVTFKRMADKKEYNGDILEKELNEILDKKGIKKDKHSEISLDLTPEVNPGGIDPKVILTINKVEQSNIVFGIISKQKLNNTMQMRSYETYETDDVFTPQEALKKGIEICTYFVLDYKTQIMSVVSSIEVPYSKYLKDIFFNYNKEYLLEFKTIPNKNGIDLLYYAEHPQIVSIEFDRPRPSAEYLQTVLGLNEDEIVDILRTDIDSVRVEIKPVPRRSLEKKADIVKKIIDIFREKKDGYNILKMQGKSSTFNTASFNFHEQYYTYPLESIKTYEKVDGEKKPLSFEEITKQYRDNLIKAYRMNKELLTNIIGGLLDDLEE